MSTSLCFNDITLSPVTHQNSLWIRAVELARALGYKNENSVSRLYRSNAEEFTPDMTQVIEMPVESRNGSLENLVVGRLRIFSLRGCHLIAMFARTPVAKEFRRWVLDVLDKIAAEERAQLAATVKTLPQALTPSTADDRAPLRALVHAWAKITNVHHAALWPQVKAHFQLSRIDDLPVEWLPDALAFVQGKIDGPQRAAELSQAVAPAALVPTVADLTTIPAEVSDLPDVKRLLKDIRRAAECLAPCENWTHIAVRGELEHAATKGTAWAVNMNVNAAWYALGLARSSLLAAIEVGRMGR